MARAEVSSADRELISAVMERGVVVSPTQLERWRGAGVMPRNLRRGAGRGRGSSSQTPEGLHDYVAAMAAISKQGHSLDNVILCLFGAGIFRGEDADPSDPVWSAFDGSLRAVLSRFIETQMAEFRVMTEAFKAADDRDDAIDRLFAELEALVTARDVRRQINASEDLARKLEESAELESVDDLRSEKIQLLAFMLLGEEEFPELADQVRTSSSPISKNYLKAVLGGDLLAQYRTSLASASFLELDVARALECGIWDLADRSTVERRGEANYEMLRTIASSFPAIAESGVYPNFAYGPTVANTTLLGLIAGPEHLMDVAGVLSVLGDQMYTDAAAELLRRALPLSTLHRTRSRSKAEHLQYVSSCIVRGGPIGIVSARLIFDQAMSYSMEMSNSQRVWSPDISDVLVRFRTNFPVEEA